MGDEINEGSAARYHRHGEMFWRELTARQTQSGVSVRKFCQANGVAHSTFHKWRTALGEEISGTGHAPLSTADAMFIPISAVREVKVNALPSPGSTAPRVPVPRGPSTDSVIVTSGGMRVEMTGAHADRIVRHLLSRMSGFPC